MIYLNLGTNDQDLKVIIPMIATTGEYFTQIPVQMYNGIRYFTCFIALIEDILTTTKANLVFLIIEQYEEYLIPLIKTG